MISTKSKVTLIKTQIVEYTPQPPEELLVTVRASELIDSSLCEDLLHLWARRIDVKELPVAASMLAKRYSSQLIYQALHHLSVQNSAPDWSVENLHLHFNSGWELTLAPINLQLNPCPEDRRDEWRRKKLQQILTNNLVPVFNSLANYAPASILWESAKGYLYYFYNIWIREASTNCDQARILDDFNLLTSPTSPLIVEKFTNPFHGGFRTIPHPTEPEKEMHVRQTCCLYHRLPGAKPCSTCPRLQKPSCDSGRSLLDS
ncbi:FhuF 2Fe-2S C-terminal domain-containing protein [Marininema mesophilum]|uniref:FhuF 2Fe-2S C-terminal domain-containing protein n=1 Tax=Marininema mesophilum TaxID=1048340 RepID=A0A1H2WE79_9BACL|nr:IucA/IucC family C-terminal-domain containing protein [Marininema mesophilum]SDW78841.1 FhuF 2Fe-2S C-terminal domain-containing protein [Marininema mesophilum]